MTWGSRISLSPLSGKLLVDNWELRRWLVWPWCAARGHRDEFWLAVRWNGIVTEHFVRCSCGRGGRREPA